MPFEKGQSGNPNGRPKEAVNKLTADGKAIVADQLIDHLEKIGQTIAEIEDPKDRLKAIKDFLGFVMPQMKSTELKADKDSKITVTYERGSVATSSEAKGDSTEGKEV